MVNEIQLKFKFMKDLEYETCQLEFEFIRNSGLENKLEKQKRVRARNYILYNSLTARSIREGFYNKGFRR